MCNIYIPNRRDITNLHSNIDIYSLVRLFVLLLIVSIILRFDYHIFVDAYIFFCCLRSFLYVSRSPVILRLCNLLLFRICFHLLNVVDMFFLASLYSWSVPVFCVEGPSFLVLKLCESVTCPRFLAMFLWDHDRLADTKMFGSACHLCVASVRIFNVFNVFQCFQCLYLQTCLLVFDVHTCLLRLLDVCTFNFTCCNKWWCLHSLLCVWLCYHDEFGAALWFCMWFASMFVCLHRFTRCVLHVASWSPVLQQTFWTSLNHHAWVTVLVCVACCISLIPGAVLQRTFWTSLTHHSSRQM